MKFLVDEYSCMPIPESQQWFPAEPNDMQNMLIVGGPSSNKEKHLDNLLIYLYGEGVKNVKETEYTISNYGSNSTKIRLRHSNYHIVLVPNNSALDKYVLQEVVVDFCKKNDLVFFKSTTRFKTVVIHRADNLSEQAQFCLRRVMETTSRQCRFLLLSTNPCNFIMPIRSRFIQINVPTASESQVYDFIRGVAEKEGIPFDGENIDRRDCQAALWKLESARHGVPHFCWWETLVDQIVGHIITGMSSGINKTTDDVRDKLGQLFVSNIDSHMVLLRMMKTLFRDLGDKKNVKTMYLLTSTIACFDCRLKNATRYILHIEALVHALAFILHGKNSERVLLDRVGDLSPCLALL